VLLLGLSGKQRSGKDTVVEILKNWVCDYDVVVFRLSGGVYEIARKYFGMKEKDRETLIAVGEKLRTIDPYVFVKYTLWRIYEYLAVTVARRVQKDVMIIVPDIRLPEELKLLKQAGFNIVRIEAPQEYRRQREGFVMEAEDHYTETALDTYKFPYVIKNTKDIKDLKAQVIETYLSIKEKVEGHI